MTTQASTSWTGLLSRRFRNVSDEYGPHSQAVASAFAVLDKMEWLQHVGEPVNADTIVVVRPWDEALTIFGKDRRYNANGVLEAPCERVEAVFGRFPEREPWWQKAREDVKPYTALYSWIRTPFPRSARTSCSRTSTSSCRCCSPRSSRHPTRSAPTSVSSSHGSTQVTSRADGTGTGRRGGCASSRIEFGTNESAAVGEVTYSWDALDCTVQSDRKRLY